MKTTINFFIIAIIALFTLVIIRVFNISYPVEVTNTSRSSELSVVGEGKVDVVPDTAYVEAGISVIEAKTVAEVQKSIDTANNKIIAAMQKLGIDKKDVKTSNYSINPNYSYENNKNGITGYNGNANITIKVKNIQQVSQVITEATAAGANQIQGARFSIENPAKYREEARSKAIANAKEQAQKLANTLGIKLGKVTNIIESSGDSGTPLMYDKMAVGLGGASANPQIEPGSQEISSVVTLYFEKR